jgi:hypothetical protein
MQAQGCEEEDISFRGPDHQWWESVHMGQFLQFM